MIETNTSSQAIQRPDGLLFPSFTFLYSLLWFSRTDFLGTATSNLRYHYIQHMKYQVGCLKQNMNGWEIYMIEN